MSSPLRTRFRDVGGLAGRLDVLPVGVGSITALDTSGALTVLDTYGTFVALAADATPGPAIATALASTFHVSPEVAERHTAEQLDHLHDLVHQAPQPTSATTADTGPLPTQVAGALVRRVRIGAATVEVAFDDRALAHDVGSILGFAPKGVTGPSVPRVHVSRADGGYRIATDGFDEERCGDLPAARSALDLVVSAVAIRATGAPLTIHAAAVASGNRCVLLPARSGTGKSTLSVAMIQRGWRLLSDEAVPLDAHGRALGVPMPIGMKGSPEEVGKRLRGLTSMQVPLRIYAGDDAHLVCPPTTQVADGAPLPVTNIVFFGREPGRLSVTEPLDAFPALRRLFDHMTLLPGAVPSDAAQAALRNAVTGARIIEVVAPDTRTIADLVDACT